MQSTTIPSTNKNDKSLRVVRILGACKFLYGIFLLAAGLGILHLLSENFGDVLEHIVLTLHLDHKNLISRELLLLAGLNHRQLEAIDAGTFLFAAIELIEGAGLFLRFRWAEYLTVIATSAFLLPECYEIVLKTNLLRITVFVINLIVVVYLLYQLRKEHLRIS